MITKDNAQIATLDDWFRRAGPKSDTQWKDGRSAKECARFWLSHAPALPAPIRTILESHPDIDPITNWSAEPEAAVRFDSARGEPANLDVLIRAQDARGPIVVAVEAKADESFGNTLGVQRARAEAALAKNPRSGALGRLQRLVQQILGLDGVTPDVEGIRYQLLTATAAALAEAERIAATRAVVLVHEFVTDATDDARHEANAADLRAFAGRVFGAVGAGSDRLLGPQRLPGSAGEVTGLYLGKVSTVLRNDPRT